MKKLIAGLILSGMLVAAYGVTTFTPVSAFPNNPSPTNGIVILLTVPGYTNQNIQVGQLLHFIGTNASFQAYLLNSNMVYNLATNGYFADNLSTNQEFLNTLGTNVFLNYSQQTNIQYYGTPIATQTWSNQIVTLNNGYTFLTTPSNTSFTILSNTATDGNQLSNTIFHSFIVISNSSSIAVTSSWLSAGNKIGTGTTNALVIPAGKIGTFTVDSWYLNWTNYITRLQQ